jgi:quinol monooxygenase YgiN
MDADSVRGESFPGRREVFPDARPPTRAGIEIEPLILLSRQARNLQNDQVNRGVWMFLAGGPGRPSVGPATNVDRREWGAMAYLEVTAHLTVRPGCLEGFRKQAAELIRITKEKDTRTLRYDWFLSSDGTECEVRETYTGPEGLVEHNSHVLEARTKLFKDYADNHFMNFYGELSQPLLDLLKSHPVGHKWFSFVQGLEPSPAGIPGTDRARQLV